MSSINDIARGMAAIVSPLTGTRATGSALIKSTSGSVLVPAASYLIPILGGQRRVDLLHKVLAGPNSDKSWTATTGGVTATITSNIGGAAMGLPAGTVFAFDPPITGIASAVTSAGTTGGAAPSFSPSLADVSIYESMDGPDRGVDLHRSFTRGFPALLVAWTESVPGDGATTSQVTRRTRASSTGVIYKESFEILLFVSRDTSEHGRREEILSLLDSITCLLTDRNAVDDAAISHPSGLFVSRRWRVTGRQEIYQRYYVYALSVSALHAIEQTDSRTFDDLHHAKLDVLNIQETVLPHQGDYPTVDDVLIHWP